MDHLKLALSGSCFIFLLTVCIYPLYAQQHRALSLNLLEFEADRWTRANPDNAGCVNYTANMNGARANIALMPGGDGATLTAQQNHVVLVCRQTVHMTGGALGQGQQIALGYVVAFTEVAIFQTDRWNRSAAGNPFWFSYTANANGSTVNFKIPPPTSRHLLFTHANNSVNFIVDNVLHLDNATNRQLVQPRPCSEEEKTKDLCNLDD